MLIVKSCKQVKYKTNIIDSIFKPTLLFHLHFENKK